MTPASRAALVALAVSAFATSVAADCWYNGRQVPEGSRVGDLVCKNGQWVKG